jgi:hypothetical protein
MTFDVSMMTVVETTKHTQILEHAHRAQTAVEFISDGFFRTMMCSIWTVSLILMLVSMAEAIEKVENNEFRPRAKSR